MKTASLLLLLCLYLPAFAQERATLTPGGFQTITFDRPARTQEKLIENAKAWAGYYNRRNEYPYDVYDVTANSLSIDAYNENAFFYRNRGEVHRHRIRYTLHVDIQEKTYTVSFAVKEIYSNNTLTELTVADFFAPDGRLKEDYEEVRPSLEKTANEAIYSFANYMARD